MRFGPGRAEVVAVRPRAEMEMDSVLRVLGLRDTRGNRELVLRLWRRGEFDGYKPGSRERADGRKSNAKIVFEAGSVYAFREARRGRAGC